MMRKATGTPFKLRGAAPFKSDELPEGVTTTTEDLGQMANDENHLVNVTKNTKITPDYSGVDNSGSRNTGKTYKETYGPEQEKKYGSFEKYVEAAEKYWESKGKGKNDGAQQGSEEITYEQEDIPTPGEPGKTMNSFTAAEGRNLGNLTRQRANAAVRDSKKLKKAEDGTLFGRLFTKKGRLQGKKAKEEHQARKIAIRKAEAEAGAKQSENANKQAAQNVNRFASDKQIEDGTGTEGTSFTIAPNGTKKLSSLTGSQSSNTNPFSGMQERLQQLKDFKLKTPLTYGRSKTATPFKLNKYKK